MTAVTSPATDPLSVFLNNARPHDKAPIPLQSTAFDITIESGLALVLTTRLFRNKEDKTIEATLTFPVPVHAVLFSLEVKIGERRLQATAKAKETAREAYEEGIEEGKTSILHEELLRGIHMLSVGNIPPGEEIEVKTVWAMPLMMAGEDGHLRIPTTVGQIYGQSPLSDGDDFSWGDEVQVANVTVRSSGVPVEVDGRLVGTDAVQVRMNQPIDLVVGEWKPTPLLSRAADGTGIELELCPAPASSAALNLAILVDHSGSMHASVPQGEDGTATVHGLVLSALKALSGQLATDDFVDLWEFSGSARHIGHSSGNQPPLSGLLEQLSPPDGGTEINACLSAVLAATKANSVLLITDGRSHAIDVQTLAGRGKRISVLLVGEDSLEAQVGYLAAMTGGDIFVAPKNLVDQVLGAALSSLRSPPTTISPADSSTGSPLEFCMSGMMIRLQRTEKSTSDSRSTLEHGVAAIAASLQIPRLSEEDAVSLATAEGLVTHLTSLVLVDEAAVAQDSIPLRRRVPLAQASGWGFGSHIAASMAQAPVRMYLHESSSSQILNGRYPTIHSYVGEEDPEETFRASLDALALIINWDEFALSLAHCLIDELDEETAWSIRRMKSSPAVIALAQEQAVAPLLIVIFLLAHKASAHNNRSATRVLFNLRKDLNQTAIKAILLLDEEQSG